jgi:hypothetical protein
MVNQVIIFKSNEDSESWYIRNAEDKQQLFLDKTTDVYKNHINSRQVCITQLDPSNLRLTQKG